MITEKKMLKLLLKDIKKASSVSERATAVSSYINFKQYSGPVVIYDNTNEETH